MSETKLQKKLAKLIQQELADILTFEFSFSPNTLVSIRAVRITRDLSLAKVYISTLPEPKRTEVVGFFTEKNWEIRKALSSKIRNKMRKMPELRFMEDDSYAEAERIEKLLDSLKNEEEDQ